MEFESVIKERRSIRKFSTQEVDDSVTDRLIECARLCQSAKNRQPWKFMILRDKEKDKIAKIMLELFEQKDIELPGYVNSSKSSANVILNAPVLILVLREKDEEWNIGDYLSIGAAIEHICLEAVNLGLGSVWIRDTAYTEQEICHEIGYDDLELVSGIAVGYADEAPSPRPRKSKDEIMLKRIDV